MIWGQERPDAHDHAGHLSAASVSPREDMEKFLLLFPIALYRLVKEKPQTVLTGQPKPQPVPKLSL